ncbi:MAG: PA2169 family four-helix-bundle protein, partial [Kiloniellales bacterium]|nr:PA2169 family four-helix-bundle protein [Kiloniellales bacterium]
MPSEEQAAALNEIIAICRDGISFYEDAASRVEEKAIKEILQDMAQLRRETVEELAPMVEETGEELRQEGTLSGRTHHLLSGIQATFAKDETLALVTQLEELEN